VSQTNQYTYLLIPGELLNIVHQSGGCEVEPESRRKAKRPHSLLSGSIHFQYLELSFNGHTRTTREVNFGLIIIFTVFLGP
jgi:hypothetical protein